MSIACLTWSTCLRPYLYWPEKMRYESSQCWLDHHHLAFHLHVYEFRAINVVLHEHNKENSAICALVVWKIDSLDLERLIRYRLCFLLTSKFACVDELLLCIDCHAVRVCMCQTSVRTLLDLVHNRDRRLVLLRIVANLNFRMKFFQAQRSYGWSMGNGCSLC